MEYVAIDFETAATTKDSACAIGLVKFSEDGEAIDAYYSLIRPKNPRFDAVCTAVHGLDPKEIMKAPFLPTLWPDITSFIKDRPLVAHNAPFDMMVLRESAASWALGGIDNDYYCTLSLSRKLWPGKKSYKLTSLAGDFGWEYDAHMALDDALICGRIFSRLCGENLYDQKQFDKFIRRLYKDRNTGFPKHVYLESGLFGLL